MTRPMRRPRSRAVWRRPPHLGPKRVTSTRPHRPTMSCTSPGASSSTSALATHAPPHRAAASTLLAVAPLSIPLLVSDRPDTDVRPGAARPTSFGLGVDGEQDER